MERLRDLLLIRTTQADSEFVRILHEAGYVLHHCSSWEEACVFSRGRYFTAILFDPSLPGEDKKNPQICLSEVVENATAIKLLIGLGVSREESFRFLGVSTYLNEPVDVGRFLRLLDKFKKSPFDRDFHHVAGKKLLDWSHGNGPQQKSRIPMIFLALFLLFCGLLFADFLLARHQEIISFFGLQEETSAVHAPALESFPQSLQEAENWRLRK